MSKTVKDLAAWVLKACSLIGGCMILGILPLYFQQGYTHIGSDKAYFLKNYVAKMGMVVLPVFLIWLVFAIICERKGGMQELGKRVAAQFRVPDFFAILFAVSAIASYLCSAYPKTALWGTKGWFMGMIPQLTFVSIYFLFSRFQFSKGAAFLLYLGLAVSVVEFILAYLNRFNFWLPMENSGRPMYIATIGNINWFCSYAITLAFVGIGLFWLHPGTKRWHTVVLAMYVFFAACMICTQGSESGIFAAAVVLFVMFLLSARKENCFLLGRFSQIVILFSLAGLFTWILCLIVPKGINFDSALGKLIYSPLAFLTLCLGLGAWYLAATNHGRLFRILANILALAVPAGAAVFVVLIVLCTKHPEGMGSLAQNSIFVFNDSWGSYRGATWSIGLKVFGEQGLLGKLVGIGPDCMADYLKNEASQALASRVQQVFNGKRLTNAHCEALTILIHMGILGFVAYVGMFVSLIVMLVRKFGVVNKQKEGKKKGEKKRQNQTLMDFGSLLAAACGLGILAYQMNGIWSFQQSMGGAVVFAIMGLGMTGCNVEKKP